MLTVHPTSPTLGAVLYHLLRLPVHQACFRFSSAAGLDLPASFAARCGHVTKP